MNQGKNYSIQYKSPEYNTTVCLFLGFLFMAFSFGLPNTLQAQDKCGVNAYNTLLKERNKDEHYNEALFEQWMQDLQNKAAAAPNKTADAVVQIPVVFHVLHMGEALGEGLNLSDAQIQSQLEVINEDFRRTNSDKSNTPADFLGVAADIEVEFVMAKQDPEGLPTNGILRLNSGKSWPLDEFHTMKALSYWPAESYLNIWIADLQSGLLGYAQFPDTNLPGMEDASKNRLTDGVVVDYTVCGSVVKYPEAELDSRYDRGRTLTHEIGHFLGLRHIWGDGGCGLDDYCADTPTQSGSHFNLGQPCTYPGPDTCDDGVNDLPDMFQNYMDYTNDVCMNLFTTDQKSRMRIVLDNSPRRLSLRTSLGLETPVVTANDMGIKSIVQPQNTVCNALSTPEVMVRNYGNNTVTSFKISLLLDGAPEETVAETLTLAPLEVALVSFSPIDLSMTETVGFSITEVNNGTDGNPLNDTKTTTPNVIAQETTFPIIATFDTPLPEWEIINPDGLLTWTEVTAQSTLPNNKALFVNNYFYDIKGEVDQFKTPIFNPIGADALLLTFSYAYFQIGTYNDGLKVYISTDCGNTFTEENVLFNKFGKELSTTESGSFNFYPTGPDDWKQASISLQAYKDYEGVQLMFENHNSHGTNIFIDDIYISTDGIYDPSLTTALSPSIAPCDLPKSASVAIKNNGSITIENFQVKCYYQDNLLQTANFTNANLQAGETMEVVFEGLNLQEDGTIKMEIEGLDNETDIELMNNAVSVAYSVATEEEIIPINVDTSLPIEGSGWSTREEGATKYWEHYEAGEAFYINQYNDPNIGAKNYLISPVLDFSTSEEASISFEYAYSYSSGSGDRLQLVYAENCNATFTNTLWDKSGSALRTTISSGQFFPQEEFEWRKIQLDLSDLTGLSDLRLAFLATNNNSNNLFIRNIKVYDQYNPDAVNIEPDPIAVYPTYVINGSIHLTFNLPKKETAHIYFYDTQGKQIQSVVRENVLNQTIDLNFESMKSAMYFVRVITDSEDKTFKVFQRR